MWAMLVLTAIFRPRTLSDRIKCSHEGTLHWSMIDAGMSKCEWCTRCGTMWHLGGLAC